MADLDTRTSSALRAALTPDIQAEFGTPLCLRDVSASGLRWDLEAIDPETGHVLRRISHTRAISEQAEQAMAEVVGDIWPAVEERLQQLGIRGCRVSFSAYALPKSRRKRRDLAVLLAERIAESARTGKPLVADFNAALEAGQSPAHDPLWRSLNHVNVYWSGDDKPAKVFSGTDIRLSSWVPPLSNIVLPVVQRKEDRHGGLAHELTLVVEVRSHEFLADSVADARAVLAQTPSHCRSIYLAAWLSGTETMGVERLK